MPLWGANTNEESKPKNLTEEEKSRTFATTKGWEITNKDGLNEVLVAIRNLNGADAVSSKLGAATISAVYFLATSYSTGATGKVRVVWNEKITPTTTGTLIVKQYDNTDTSAVTIANITATRAGNTTSNFVDFTFSAGSSTALTYTIPAQTITLGVNDFGFTTVTSQTLVVTSNVVNATAAQTGSTGITTVAA
jgi:hypothetical protein